MSTPPTWVDVEHQQQELLVSLPVDVALRLKSTLPYLVARLGEGRGRDPDERDDRRETARVLDVLMRQIGEALRPFDVPQDSPAAPRADRE